MLHKNIETKLVKFAVVPFAGNVDWNCSCRYVMPNRRRSFPLRGTWIEISCLALRSFGSLSFPLRGTWIEIGMNRWEVQPYSLSFPLRGTWIEMVLEYALRNYVNSRSLCGERGLKWYKDAETAVALARRSLCGERGLKYPRCAGLDKQLSQSFPLRGTWIEIRESVETPCLTAVVPFAGNVDWNLGAISRYQFYRSRSLCGERGLKSARVTTRPIVMCRSLCGERGLKSHHIGTKTTLNRRSLCGERGLK